MKTLKILTTLLFFTLILPIQAQTADEILANYFENTGGLDNWKALEGLKIAGKVNQQGMEFPINVLQLKDGRQMSSFVFQGKEIKQGVYDGETLWNTNFMTMKAEKADAEQTANFKLNTNDFPDAFIDYKAKGYTVELIGKETTDGTETFKIKLVKEPVTVDGVEKDDVSFYYFDTENFVPIAVESEITSGQGKGQMSKTTMSDYQEAGGLYFAYSTTQYVNGNLIWTMSMDNIEINPAVDEGAFAFPEEIAEEK